MSRPTPRFRDSLKLKIKGFIENVERSLSPIPPSPNSEASAGQLQHGDSGSTQLNAPSTTTQGSRPTIQFGSPEVIIDTVAEVDAMEPSVSITNLLALVFVLRVITKKVMSRAVSGGKILTETKIGMDRVSQPGTAIPEDTENVVMINFNPTMDTSSVITPRRLNSSTRFSGRKDVLESLQEHFRPRSTGERRMFLLYGMGGIGKTQICLKFSEESSEIFSDIFWIDASSLDTIMVSIKGIARSSGAQAAGVDGSVEAVLLWIGSLMTQWLLIFDNADGAPEVVEEFLPPGSRGNILITSRNPSVRRITSANNSLELAEMQEEDAVTLLLKASCLDTLDEELREIAREIVSELYCLPLAVDQAGAAIESGLCSIGNYLQLFSEHRGDLMSNPSFLGASKYEKNVYGTWELSFNEIKHRAELSGGNADAAQSAILILQTCAFYHYDSISEDIFRFAAEESRKRDIEAEVELGLPLAITSLDYRLLPVGQDNKWDAYFFRKGLQVLLSFSLIKKQSTSEVFSIHPLVHSWSRDQLDEKEQQRLCRAAFIILSSGISTQKSQSQDYAFESSLYLHIKANEQYSSEIGLQEKYFDDAYSRLQQVFYAAGDWSKTEKLGLEIMDVNKRILGADHPSTLISMENLAQIYSRQKQWAKAEELQEQVLDIKQGMLGANHLDTLRSMENLASTYSEQGHWKMAEEMQVQVLKMQNKVLGAEHPDNLRIVRDLTSMYSSQGCWRAAEAMLVQVLNVRKTLLGDEHPETLKSKENLAKTQDALGQKAKEMMAKEMKAAEYPNTRSMSDMAFK
ncbi:P-loop containing nucleoside triphosphate hydrolase protein [Crassisporium funariophilum]|nr:P-loop containing nucleoside triphosphate hydrolase protein [Crassisporium funariophilum]